MFSPLLQFNMLNSFQWCHKLTCQATQTKRAMLWKRHSVSLSKEVLLNIEEITSNPFCCQRCWCFSAARVASCSIHTSGTEVEETAHLSCTVRLFQTLLCRLNGICVIRPVWFLFFSLFFFPACMFMCLHVSGMRICGWFNCCNPIAGYMPHVIWRWLMNGWMLSDCEAHY